MAAGFIGFEITWREEVYGGAPQASSAADFGTLGITFRARKPRDEQEWQAAMLAASCELPPVRQAGSTGPDGRSHGPS
ncbi:MAG TPA: hypothetical protein VGR57_16700 [Ktedonobacterales bacterium]|nr:hypothetical protein [Ktedonobacterales bacterium]